MRLFFDTEFLEDGRTIELISIGIVNAQGRTYYAETTDAHTLASATQWLAENVKPHLRGGSFIKPREQIRAEILAFAGNRPEFWSYYCNYDWVVLCQLFGRMVDLPENWPAWCRELKQLMATHPNHAHIAMPAKAGPAHDALADAFYHRAIYNAFVH